MPLAQAAFADALKAAGLTVDAVDHLVVTGLHARAVRATRPRSGVDAAALAPDHARFRRQPGRRPAGGEPGRRVWSAANPGQVVVTLQLADGADAQVWRLTDALPAAAGSPRRPPALATVAEQAASGRTDCPTPPS